MSAFTTAHSRRLDLALALLRSAVGAVFVAHGAQKLFTFGLAGVAGAFGQMGIPFAGVVGPAVAFLEFFGGIALIAGAGTRVAGLALALNMLGALTMVHLPAGFFLPSGIEFVLTLANQPPTLFSGGIKLLIFTVLPAAFVGHVPAELVRSCEPRDLLLATFGTLLYTATAVWTFGRGLRRYASGSRFGVWA